MSINLLIDPPMAALADWISWLWGLFVANLAALEDWISWFWTCFVANRENILSLATILAGLIGIPLLYIRTRAADRSARAALEQAKVAAEQAKTAAERHEEQTKADRERRITESFAKAVEQLGSDKLTTRLGAIYTLERLSRESEREYWPIMETLTAYVRDRAPWPPRQAAFHPFVQLPGGAMDEIAEESLSSDESTDQEKEPKPRPWIEGIQPATDIQAILRGAQLSGAHLEHAILRNAHLEDAWLDETHLEHAILSNAHFEHALLMETHLEHAILDNAHLERAGLLGAHLKGADLSGPHLKGAFLSGTCLEKASLMKAHLEGAQLGISHGFEAAKGLTQEQINSALGDENTILPEGLERPAHWIER